MGSGSSGRSRRYGGAERIRIPEFDIAEPRFAEQLGHLLLGVTGDDGLVGGGNRHRCGGTNSLAQRVQRLGAKQEIDHERCPGALGRDRVRVASFVVLLAAGALLAIGLAGAVAGVGALMAGPGFIAGRAPSTGASALDCARWMALYPGARDCAAAAAQDAVHDVIMGSGVAGVLGAVLLVAYLIFRMVWSARHLAPEPPAYRHGWR